MAQKEIEEKILQVEKALGEEDLDKVFALLENLRAIDDGIIYKNGLACAYFHQGDKEKSLEILDSLEEKDAYSLALASKCYFHLGEEKKAREEMEKAIDSFNRTIRKYRRPGKEYRSYSTIILQAIANLEDHRLLDRVYKEWREYHFRAENHYYGGVACFNLKRYRQAGKCWKKFGEYHEHGPYMARVADEVQAGNVPPFPLDYQMWMAEFNDIFHSDQDFAATENELRDRAKEGSIRLGLLSLFFFQPERQAWVLQPLIAQTGEWGIELGKNLLQNNSLALQAKKRAFSILVDLGVFKHGEQVTILHAGEELYFGVKEKEIKFGYDFKLGVLLKEVKKLKREGKLEEALKVLQKFQFEEEVYAEALLIEANIHRVLENYETSREKLEILLEASPNDPFILLNYGGLIGVLGDKTKARQYIDKAEKAFEEGNYSEQSIAFLYQEMSVDLFGDERKWEDAFREILQNLRRELGEE